MKNFKGTFAIGWWSALFSKNRDLLYLARKESVSFSENGVTIHFQGKDTNIDKKDLKSFQSWGIGNVRINHTNPMLPKLLIFTPTSPFGKMEMFKTIRSLGGYEITGWFQK